jgi:hypothetical protein
MFEELPIMKTTTRTRSIALLTGGVLVATALVVPTSAQAAENGKTYKTGAAVLGVLSAILVAKGKTLPGAIAGAGAYYSYKKGQKTQNQEQYGEWFPGADDNDYRDSPYYGGNNTYPTYPSSGNGGPYYGSNSDYDDSEYYGNDGNSYPSYGYGRGRTANGENHGGRFGRRNERLELK